LSVELTVREPLGDRSFGGGEFPLSIGGAGSELVVPAPAAGPLAWIALHDGQLYVQPAQGAAGVLVNGAAITGSTWLRSGDVLDVGGGRLRLWIDAAGRVLDVLAGGDANVTAPPVAAASASVAGVGADEGESIEAVAFRPPPRAAVPRWSPRKAALAAGAAILALVALVVFTSTPVEVEISPQPQRIAFEGRWPGLALGSSHLLRPGEYTLVAERDGYELLRVPVTVGNGPDQVLRFRLRPLPGKLHVSLPVPGQVSIDGRAVGTAPGDFELPAGTYKIDITTEKYLPYATQVQMAGLGRRQELAPKLKPAWAAVRIVSVPAGADVVVGKDARGTTPLEIELMQGSHHVELRHPGFRTWESDLQVKAGEPMTVGPVELGLPDGRLSVRSTPAGASVTIGGAYRGRTPLDVDVRPGLPQAVALSRDGYEPASRQVTVAAGRIAAVTVTLAPVLGKVIVSAKPEDAELLIDGQARGAANQTLELVATPHAVEIRKSGYAPYRTTVTPRPGLPQSIEVALLEGVTPAAGGQAGAAPAHGEVIALLPVIRSKAGQELRLAPAGEYTMGSPRREAGRRANESERLVDLQRRFYVSTREVTNAEYEQFRPEHRSGYVLQTTLDLDQQPVVNVSWQEAAAYCNWLSQQEGLPPAYVMKGGAFVPVVPIPTGYRLPTEAEWEWIARRDGGGLNKYPWGDALPVPPGAGNYADRSAKALLPVVLDYYDDHYAATAPVGRFGANPSGYYDLGGNVAEWTHDLYTVQPGSTQAAVDPAANGEGPTRVIRGSSWKSAAVTELRLAYRDYGDGRRNDLGFRIARYAQ
jgi:formylglycine-generating enzyme required for sulfatase activity